MLHRDRNPTLAPGVPIDRAAVHRDARLGGGIDRGEAALFELEQAGLQPTALLLRAGRRAVLAPGVIERAVAAERVSFGIRAAPGFVRRWVQDGLERGRYAHVQ